MNIKKIFMRELTYNEESTRYLYSTLGFFLFLFTLCMMLTHGEPQEKTLNIASIFLMAEFLYAMLSLMSCFGRRMYHYGRTSEFGSVYKVIDQEAQPKMGGLGQGMFIAILLTFFVMFITTVLNI